MRSVTIAMVLAVSAAPVSAGELTWHFYRGDEPAAFLAVVDEDEIESPEPHYPFLMTCSLDDDWLMVVSDIDPKQLGETIAGGEQPVFAFVATAGGKPSTSGEYFPEISFGQMEGVWEYSSIWDLGTLDNLVAADKVAIKGAGIDVALPQKAMKASLDQFKAFCGSLSESSEEDGTEGETP